MSEFKKGDRVKVTYEGEYRGNFRASGGRHFHILDLGEGFTVSVPGDATIEKLPDPLPTTPGSLIRMKSAGWLYFLTEGGWHRTDGSTVLNGMGRPDGWEVIFDAGADK